MTPETLGTLQAVGGLLLTGTGLSMAIDAGTVRARKGKWFLYGTIALIIFQAGCALWWVPVTGIDQSCVFIKLSTSFRACSKL